MRSLQALRSKAAMHVERGFALEHSVNWCREWKDKMSTEQAVAVVTGDSRGIGAALVQAFRIATTVSLPRHDLSNNVTMRTSYGAGGCRQPNTANLVFKEAWIASAASIRWSTTPARSSPSRSSLFE